MKKWFLFGSQCIWTHVESAVGNNGVGGLSDVSGMDEVVVRVAVLAVALLHYRQKVLETKRVDLGSHTAASRRYSTS